MREMKDSGIEWIGEIPVGWEVCRIKELFHEVNERCENGNDYTLLSVSEYYGVSPKSQRISDDDMLTHAETLDGYKVCHENDIVMNIMLAWKRALGVSQYEGIVSPAYCVYRTNKDLDSKYFHYLYRTDMYANLFKQFSTGIIDSRLRLYPDKFLSLKCQVPPLEEQHRISTYLDTKCEKIDSIIARQQEVIEKLKAYKLSVITEAVTKGLNLDVRMKDSGVEFLGEIPENWDVLKFGRCITIKSNLVPPENYYDYPQIAPDSIEKNSAKLLDYKTVRDSGVISWNHLFFKGQIIYSKIRPLLNKVIIAPFDGLCSADMYPIETENNSKFIVYVILSDYFSAQVGLVTENRVKMPKINQNELSGIIVAMPELEEQQQIADYLDKKCSAIDSAIAKKQAIIEKLTAYKKSLIYEVVTGKREVKGSDNLTNGVYSVFISPDVKSYAESLLFHKIINMAGKNLKGRTHLMKIFHAVEIVIGFDFGTQYIRHTHGPYSDKIENLEKDLTDKGWLSVKKGKHIEYSVLDSSSYESDYNKFFKNYDSYIRNIVNCFLAMKRTSKAEKFATLLASWNDFIIDGIEPTDEMIINDVRTNWTENKANTDKETWQEILKQIKKANIIPRGYGKHTIRKDN